METTVLKAAWGGVLVAAMLVPTGVMAQEGGAPKLGQKTVGSFTISTQQDGITGKVSTGFLTVANDNLAQHLVWACVADEEFGGSTVRVGFGWDKRLIGGTRYTKDTVTVQYRFPSDVEPGESYWTLTPTHTSALSPWRISARFTASAERNESVVVRVVDMDGEQLTFTFSLLNLREALTHLPCYASLQVQKDKDAAETAEYEAEMAAEKAKEAKKKKKGGEE